MTLGDNPDIVFPDDAQYSLSTPVITSSDYKVMSLTKFIPAGCDNSDYCEDSADYPDVESVKEIVNNFGNHDLTKILFTVTDPQ